MNVRLFNLALLIVIAALPVAAQSSGGFGPKKGPHAIIKNKPEPDWPKIIKKNSQLLIVLRAVFTSDAKVTNVRLVETSPKEPVDYTEDEIKDLVDRAKDAARRIKFIPAMKDGKNVSMWMQLEYSFQPIEKDTSAAQEPKKP